MRYQLPWPAIKTCEVGFLHAGGSIPCRPHGGHITFCDIALIVPADRDFAIRGFEVQNCVISQASTGNQSIYLQVQMMYLPTSCGGCE